MNFSTGFTVRSEIWVLLIQTSTPVGKDNLSLCLVSSLKLQIFINFSFTATLEPLILAAPIGQRPFSFPFFTNASVPISTDIYNKAIYCCQSRGILSPLSYTQEADPWRAPLHPDSSKPSALLAVFIPCLIFSHSLQFFLKV